VTRLVFQREGPAFRREHPLASWAVHVLRLGLLAAILGVIHWQHARTLAQSQARSLVDVPLAQVQALFPSASKLGDPESHGGLTVLDQASNSLGYVIQTSPESDRYLGFSGPTNCLIGFDMAGHIAGVAISSSRDTRDHVELIKRDRRFLHSWNSLSWDQAARRTDVDGVAGATLTSLAIAQGLQRRLGGAAKSQKFPQPLTVADAQQLFPEAAAINVDADFTNLWHVDDHHARELGLILRTSPAADEVIGFQGPTETRIGIRAGGQIVGVAVGSSFDNEPYVTYVREDEYFRALFQRYNLPQLATLDWKEAGIEGVSGATMTSMAVARGIVKAAEDYESTRQQQKTEATTNLRQRWRSAATLAIIAFGIVMGTSKLRSVPWLRVSFQILLIGYLGLASGDLLSMAMFVGWGQSGVPWQNAIGLVALAAAAIILPIAKGQNVYCSHLCPHGAAQQLLPRSWRLRRLPPWLGRTLRLLRPALLAWIVFVTLCNWPFNLVNIEPFDAYSWRAAAWPTVTVAVVGLMASLFLPMAYCHYGCPTGAVLEYLRRHRRSSRLTRADIFAACCLVLAIALLCWLPLGVQGRP
jgi:NosR/NirI family nitrous oxide reductase transcriptional regulator